MVYVVTTTGDRPPIGSDPKIRDADLVVLYHGDGTWTVYRDRKGGCSHYRQPWDRLPSRVKRAVPLYPPG